MKICFSAFFLLLSFFANAQQTVYTVAGSDTSTAYVTLGDGGPATAAVIGSTEGIWMDGECNLYISDLGDSRIRKVNGTTGIITTIAGRYDGTGGGFSGDNGPATNAEIKSPYGLYADNVGNVYFADRSNFRIRKVDAVTGIITTFAGGGSSLGDGGPATNAQLTDPPNIYGDGNGNFYIGDKDRIRKVNGTTGIITTIAGTGTFGLSGDGGQATNAQIYSASGMLLDGIGNLLFADRGNSRIRKINLSSGIISTVAGCTIAGSNYGFSGDGGPATAAQLTGAISFVIDEHRNILIGDNVNNFVRKVDASTGIITSFAGVGAGVTGSSAEGAPATAADIHPEFLYLDLHGNLLYSNYGRQIRKITNCTPGLYASGSRCGTVSAVPQMQVTNNIELYPNPAYSTLTIQATTAIGNIIIINMLGQVVTTTYTNSEKADIDVGKLPGGIYFVKVKGVYAGRFVKE